MELLGYAFKDDKEEKFLIEFIDLLNVIPLTDEIVDTTIKLRKLTKVKLPDAIIYATAQVFNAKLITNNIADFDKITGNVELINPL